MVNEPRVAADQWLSFVGELSEIASGKSERAPLAGDRRFADATWKTSPLHSGLLKAYLAWGEALDNFVSETSLSAADKERAHLFTTILVDALAPTNSLIANPAAMRKLIDSGGQSLLSGLKNYIEDLVKNGGLPSQVDTSAFKVGENLANTPGAVVFRNELIELIQYAPTTPRVWKRPLVMTPPQINKFYAMDLSPDKSIVRFLLDSGVQTFCVSWRNPTIENRDWGLDTYVAALDQAVDAVRDVTGSDDVTMMGTCSGGITSAAYHCDAGSRESQESGARGLPPRHRRCDRQRLRLADHAGDDDGRQGGIAAARRSRRAGPRAHVRLDAAERSDLELLGQQLPARQRAPRLRHPLTGTRIRPGCRRACTATISISISPTRSSTPAN